MNNDERANYGSAWDEILEAYLFDFIKYLPNIAAGVDLELPYEFLNDDFQQMTRYVEFNQGYTSKLVRVWLNQQEEEWLMIHIHVQGGYFEQLPSKMYNINYGVFERYGKHPYPLVILCDDDKNWRPNQFSFGHKEFGSYVDFTFQNLKLLDFNSKKRWKQLEASTNPFATVIMAHCLAQNTLQAPNERKVWKTKLTHRLYEKAFLEQDIRNLYKFIDKALVLPEPLEQEFWEELKQFEYYRHVTYITMKSAD